MRTLRESRDSTDCVTRRTAVAPYRGPRLRLPPHPEAPDPTYLTGVRRWVRSVVGPTAIDLFCGAGGLSLGLKDAGFNVLAGADVDPFAIETHLANIGGLGYLGDLSEPADLLDHLDAWGIREVDLIAGGVPCQPFSRAGRSKIKSLVRSGIRSALDPRTDLWRSFARVVEWLRPRAVLLENVPDLAVWEDGVVLTGFRDSLRTLGYETTFRILNAFDYRVPQHRTRLFVVGLRSGREFSWPDPEPVQYMLGDAIGDLPPAPPAQRNDHVGYAGPKTPLQRRLRRGVPPSEGNRVYDHITRDVRADDAEAFALLEPGQTYADLPVHLRRYRADIFTDKYNRLRSDTLCRSITAHIARDAYWYIHPEQNRTLSIREAARIQTFPDWFRFAGEPSHRFRQIGNAVPPLLAEAIGNKLIDVVRQRSRPPRGQATSFRDSLLAWHGANARGFPWREERDPWLVLMAETCLHRIQDRQIVPAYQRLAQVAGTPADLVANHRTVLEAMGSFGLRRRADLVLQMAQVIVDQHGGKVPDTVDELNALPGVGHYASGAVMVFAFGRPSVLLDASTTRIVTRVRGLEKVGRWQLRSEIYDLAGTRGADGPFNHAMLDLGALTCVARGPMCRSCPVRPHCVAGQNQVRV